MDCRESESSTVCLLFVVCLLAYLATTTTSKGSIGDFLHLFTVNLELPGFFGQERANGNVHFSEMCEILDRTAKMYRDETVRV